LSTTTTSPYFKSNISRIEPGYMNVRGYDLLDLIQNASWSDVQFLTIVGRRPTEAERKVFDAIMISAVDGGFMSAMAVAARYAASGGATVSGGVSAGVATAGYHTASPQRGAEMLLEIRQGREPSEITAEDVVPAIKLRLERGERIAGLGHPVHKTWDPRTEGLRAVAESVGMADGNLRVMDLVQQETERITGKTLPLNVDGAMAALMLDMGIGGEEMLAINILASVTGISAHVIEEIRTGVPLRIVLEHDLEYTLPRETTPWDGE
jgi:citrate synthase